MPFPRVSTNLIFKATAWFALILLVVSVPLGEHNRLVSQRYSPILAQQSLWVGGSLAASQCATKLRNSGTTNSRVTSTKGAAVAKGPVPSGSQCPDSADLGAAIPSPVEVLGVTREIQANPPQFHIATRFFSVPRARSPPMRARPI